MKEYSPFTPGNPVQKEFFVGRETQITEILKYANQVTGGKMENIFLSGERGIGKSSLASILCYHLQEEKNFLSLHVFLGGVDSLNELSRRIFENIYKVSNKKRWFGKISDFFGNYVEKVGIFGIDVTFNPSDVKLTEITRNFPTALSNLIEKIKSDKKALFIILDDINGFCKKPDFAHWYKSFVDQVATHKMEFPVFMMLIGLPGIRDALSDHQPSLLRIFRVIEVEHLDDKEVTEFFRKSFDSVSIKIENDALKLMTRFSSGLPILMQEIGDAVFWRATGDIVTVHIAQLGVLEAADRVGKKYLDPKVYRAIRSERYRSILRKIGEDLKMGFNKKDIFTKLKENEQKVFDNFLKRMIELGIIIKDIEKSRGCYKFVNDLYPIYIWLESKNFIQGKYRK